MKRQEIVDEARRILAGNPKWQMMGRKPNSLDCFGVIVLLRQKFKLYTDDSFRYGEYPQMDKALPIAKTMFNQVNPPLKPGQVVIFQFENYPWHCGIYATDANGKGTIIHSSASYRKMVEEPYSLDLQSHFRAALDWKEIED